MLVYPFLKLNFQWVSVFVHMGYRDCTLLSSHYRIIKNLKGYNCPSTILICEFSCLKGKFCLSPV